MTQHDNTSFLFVDCNKLALLPYDNVDFLLPVDIYDYKFVLYTNLSSFYILSIFENLIIILNMMVGKIIINIFN